MSRGQLIEELMCLVGHDCHNPVKFRRWLVSLSLEDLELAKSLAMENRDEAKPTEERFDVPTP